LRSCSMVRIKLCGMTNLDDCRKAVELGVDYVGFVFYKKSSRYVTPRRVKQIVQKLNGGIRTVGVFVEESDAQIAELVDYCGLDFAQVYRPASLPNAITAIRIAERLPEIPSGEGLVLFDTYTDGFGGAGRSFDFSLLEGCAALARAFVAGGIGEHNVQNVLRLQPFGIDLVSSVETYRGKKDHGKMERFVKTVRSFVP
jgi:phosphoribosylanthranilate isomerase